MSDSVITVENLGKRYTLQHQVAPGLFRDQLANLWRAPARWLTRNSPRAVGQGEEFWALRDVNFSIRRGEVVGIIGRNGAGKSTLLKILSRIIEPTTGRVRIQGRVASLLEVGTGFHPELSGRENIFLNGAILGMTRLEIRRKFDEIVAFAEVEKFLDTPVKHYSSGMYVRLAFAVAAHLEPEILIVDEVLAVGDAAFQKKCLGKMESVARNDGRTVLIVSHNMIAMQQLCGKILRFHGGKLAGQGAPLDQIRAYLGTNQQHGRLASLTQARRFLDPLDRARFRTVELNNREELPSWTLPLDEPLRLTFTVDVTHHLGSLELGLGLFNLQGIEVVSTLSSWKRDLGPVEPGAYQLTVDYGVLELTPGPYYFGVGLKSEQGLEDYLTGAFELEVIVAPTETRPNLNTIRGAIARSANFTITRLN